MKKNVILVLLLVIFIPLLSGCDPEHYYYNYEELIEKVINVELINYDNNDAKSLFGEQDKVIPFSFDKMKIVEALKVEEINIFLKDLSTIRFMMYRRHSNSPNGISLRIIYENGDFDIVSYIVIYFGKFNSDGSVKEFIGGLSGKRDLIALINKYFIDQIE